MAAHYLTPLFSPRQVAVIGAGDHPESVGGRVFENVLGGGFSGEIFAVNPKHETVCGFPCHASISSPGVPVDLALIATPAETFPGILEECGEAGVRAAVVLSAGFAETGEAGRHLQQRAVETAKHHGIRLLGPNCLGVIRPPIGLNATFGKTGAAPGDVALVSQSGALCTAILDWADAQGIGFSTVVSLGGAADLDFGELLDFLAMDSRTRSILLYIEGVNRGRSFMSGLRAAARLKPVIVMKSGRHGAGVQAAISHSGALIGGDNVFDAALDRAGVVRVPSIGGLFSAARLLAGNADTPGSALAIVTNAGGAGVIAADCAADHGIELAALEASTLESLDANLPAQWSHHNPVDILGDAGPERYAAAIDACAADPGVDALLIMLTPQAMTDPTKVANTVITKAGTADKPVLACWMGGTNVVEARALFAERHIPEFRTPESAVAAFSQMVRYRRNQRLLLQVPGPLSDRSSPNVSAARDLIRKVTESGRTTLTAIEAKTILQAFHVPVNRTIETHSAGAAVRAAGEIGYPVALKISSPDLTHKTDVGGIELNVHGPSEVEDAYLALCRRVSEANPEAEIHGVTVEGMHRAPHGRELIVGVISDPVFGPAISFGAGGTAVEIFRDQAISLPPLNEVLIKSMISQTRISRLLEPFRQMPGVNARALVDVLLRVSEMVCELPEIAEMDINPLVADADGVMALDARIRLTGAAPVADPYGHMTIAPYPHHLEKETRLASGHAVVIRPIRPEDAQIEQSFVRKLSEESRFFRFMQALQELTPQMLVRFTQIDYDREMAFIAVTTEDDTEIEIGVARYVTNMDRTSCEFGVVVADEWQGRGVASALMRALMEEARSKGLQRMEGEVLSYNHHMLELARRLGFQVAPDPDDASLRLISRAL